ncbi:MAG TPA: LysR family transcriptional regulator [Rubellimicrobium sp.]|nr:LysR family transcriptional regulator [Rubellimicrobium sp.]
MRPSDYAELRAFAAVLRHGNFTRAARHLDLSPSAVSQTVRALEERLGTRLLHRTTRSVAPTEAGSRLAERLLPLLDDLATMASAAALPEGAPAGRLRLNSNRFAARHILAPLIAPFLRAHPQVTLELVVEDAFVDIVAEGFDAGIRLGEALEADMIAMPLGPDLRMAVVAAPAYRAARGTPEHPRDLARHACLGLTYSDGSPYRWEFEKGTTELRVAVESPFVSSDPPVRLAAARDGLGLTYCFEEEATELLASGALVRVLADWTPPFPGCYLYHPSRRQVPAPLRAFIDFAKARRSDPA